MKKWNSHSRLVKMQTAEPLCQILDIYLPDEPAISLKRNENSCPRRRLLCDHRSFICNSEKPETSPNAHQWVNGQNVVPLEVEYFSAEKRKGSCRSHSRVES